MRFRLVCVAAVAAAGLLSGCGQLETGLQREAARQLQARVLEVTEASARNDLPTALAALDGLEAELEEAQANGQVSEERRRSITTIATAVRAELEEAVAAEQKAAAEKAAAEQAAADKAAADQAAASQAAEEARLAAEREAARQAPAPAPAPVPEPEPEKDEDRKDEDKGQGKGKD